MEYQLHVENCMLTVYDMVNTEAQTILVLLHGGPGSGAAPIMELSAFQILEKKYHCIYFDQRGCGKSMYDVSKGLHKMQLCEDVHKVICNVKQRYPDKKLCLWGGSFGGVLACLYMETYQDIDKVILSSPAITLHREDAIALFMRNKAMMEHRLPTSTTQSYHQDSIEPEQMLSDQNFTKFVFSANNPSTSLRHIVAMASWFYKYSATNCLKHSSIPTLIMIGEDDPICDANLLSTQLANINNHVIQCKVIKHCGHAIFEDQEALFIMTIKTFINDK